MINMLGLR